MASRFLTAAGEAMRAFGSKRDPRPLDPAAVSWTDAWLAVILLAVAQAAMILGPNAAIIGDMLPLLGDLGLVTALTLAVPFVVVAVAARLAKQPEKLPLLIMFVALSLLMIQLASFLLSFVGFTGSSALVAVTAVFVARATKTVLGISLGMSILVGVIVAAGTVAASLLLFALPAGQAILAAA